MIIVIAKLEKQKMLQISLNSFRKAAANLVIFFLFFVFPGQLFKTFNLDQNLDPIFSYPGSGYPSYFYAGFSKQHWTGSP